MAVCLHWVPRQVGCGRAGRAGLDGLGGGPRHRSKCAPMSVLAPHSFNRATLWVRKGVGYRGQNHCQRFNGLTLLAYLNYAPRLRYTHED